MPVTFDPTTLFASGEMGVIYDVQDLASMFQDSAGTTPAVVDSPVGRINDLSGNGNHCVQATAGKRPILRQDATGYYLESDGVDDWLSVTFGAAIAQPWTRWSFLDQRTWSSTKILIGGGTSSVGGLWTRDYTSGLQMYSGSFMLPTTVEQIQQNTPALVGEVHQGATSTIQVNQNPAVTATSTAGTTAAPGISLFARADDNFQSAARIYGVVMISRALTSTERENVQYWLTRDKLRVLAIDGDSLMWNQVNPGYKYLPNMSPASFVQFLGEPGTDLDTNTTPTGLVNTPARLARIDARLPVDKRGRQYVYFCHFTNQCPTAGAFGGGPRTQAQWAAAFGMYLAARKTAGWDKVGLATLLERTDSSNNSATRGAYNTIIRDAAWRTTYGIDFLVDWDADAIMGAVGMSANATYCSDLVHWTSAGSVINETYFRTAVNALALEEPAAEPEAPPAPEVLLDNSVRTSALAVLRFQGQA